MTTPTREERRKNLQLYRGMGIPDDVRKEIETLVQITNDVDWDWLELRRLLIYLYRKRTTKDNLLFTYSLSMKDRLPKWDVLRYYYNRDTMKCGIWETPEEAMTNLKPMEMPKPLPFPIKSLKEEQEAEKKVEKCPYCWSEDISCWCTRDSIESMD